MAIRARCWRASSPKGCGFFEVGEDLDVGGDVGWGGDDGGGDVPGGVVAELEATAGELGDGRGLGNDADAEVRPRGGFGDGVGLPSHDGR